MKKNTAITASILTAATIFLTIQGFETKKKLSLTGIWRIAEVQTINANKISSTSFPAESEALFTKDHYSFCWTTHTTSLRNWQLPDSAKLNRTNQSIVNAGKYELKDSILTTKAAFAMNPMFVNGIAKFRCSFSGDTLILTGISVHSAEGILHPVYAAGAQIISKLVRDRD